MINGFTSGGFGTDLTGSPISTATCQNGCHNTFALNGGPGGVSMSVPTSYYPGTSYAISLTVNQATPKYGFMAGVLRDDNTNGGTLSGGTGSAATTIAGRSYVRHNSSNTTGTWNFNWTAPSYSDTVTFYAVGNAANNSSGNQGDYIYTNSFTVFPLELITFTQNVTNVGCFSQCNGSISITNFTGGAGAPYTFAWSNSATTANINNLCAGSYTLTITDVDGNQEITTFQVGTPTAIAANVVATPSTCATGDGSIVSTPTGGTGNYTYLWNTGSTDSLILNASIGTYTVTVTDGSGCTTVASGAVSENGSGLLADLTTTDENCDLMNGSINISMQNGTAPFSYVWNTGANGNVLSNIVAGIYTVTVTDANGCEEVFSDTVSATEAVINEGATMVSDLICAGDGTGSINVIMADGAAPFGFAWSNAAVGSIISNLSGGTYTVTVTDAAGCTDVATFEINEPDSIVAAADVINAFGGDCNGSISITAFGGSGVLSYQWSHDAGATAATLNELCAGDYSITVTDANGCSVEVTTTIDANLGVSEEALSTLKLIPNPSQDLVKLHGSLDGIKSVTLMDMSGRTLRTWTSSLNQAFEISAFESGRYIVLIQGNDKFIHLPLLIYR
jgi:hypothetical protein